MRYRTQIIAAIALFALLVGIPSLQAAASTLNVNGATGTVVTGAPCPTPITSATYKTIQAALDCAAGGDIIVIAAGTYTENLSISKDITLQGASAASVTVNGAGIGRVVTVDAAVTVKLSGVTLTNGSAADGAGIYSSASSLSLSDLSISGNTATTRGGGIFTDAGTVDVTNGTISGNQAVSGGGIYTLAGTVTVLGGTLTANTASGVGGGVFTQAGSLSATANTILGNSAPIDPEIHTVVGAVDQDAQLTVIDTGVLLQGRPAAPDARWITALTVTIIPAAGGAPVFDQIVTTDETGGFSITVASGSYKIRVKGAHTLARVVTTTLVPGDNVVDIPLLLEGDANDSNSVTILDFSILAVAFGKANGQPGYDARADFNGDNAITILDFSLLAANFGKAGEVF